MNENTIERMAVIKISDKGWLFVAHLLLDMPQGYSGIYLHFADLDSHQCFNVIKKLLLFDGFTLQEERAIKAALRSEVDCIRFVLMGDE